MCELQLTVGIMSRTALFKTLCVKGGTHPDFQSMRARTASAAWRSARFSRNCRMMMGAKRHGGRPGWPHAGKSATKSSSWKSGPSASRSVRYGWPLGKAAWATRAISSGTGSRGCGRSDMTDVLLLVGWRHDSRRCPYYAIACSPGAPLGSGSALPTYFLLQKSFLYQTQRKSLLLEVGQGTNFRRSVNRAQPVALAQSLC